MNLHDKVALSSLQVYSLVLVQHAKVNLVHLYVPIDLPPPSFMVLKKLKIAKSRPQPAHSRGNWFFAVNAYVTRYILVEIVSKVTFTPVHL
jgi:hypothetical protein